MYLRKRDSIKEDKTMNLRQKQLTELLLKEISEKPVKFFAEKLLVSNRTIFSDISKIEAYLNSKGYILVRKRGVGIKLKKTLEHNPMLKSKTITYGTRGRRIKILELLLFSKNNLTMEKLAEYFYVSKSSISIDISYIKEKFLVGNVVKIESDISGTRISGTEFQIQNSMLIFNNILQEENKSMEFHEPGFCYELYRLYSEEIVNICRSLLYSYVKNNLNTIADYYINNILNILIILCYRAKKGFHMESDGTNSSIGNCMGKFLLQKASEKLSIDFTNSDIVYFEKKLSANKFVMEPCKEDFKNMVEDIVKDLSQILGINLKHDKLLKQQLKDHLSPMLHRLRNGTILKNPFLDQIKQEFAPMFSITWLVMEKYEQKLNVIFNDDEIGFIMLYFQSALDRNQISKRILILCPTGITTSGLLLNRIRKVLPPFDAIQISSMRDLKTIDFNKVDLVISTAHVSIEDVPVVLVSPLVTEEDMKNVSRIYNLNFMNQDKTVMENKDLKNRDLVLKKFLNEQFIWYGTDYDSAIQVIDEMMKSLKEAGYIKAGYKESLINRERQGGTELPTGVAVPHGNPLYVNKSVVAIVKNNKNIYWNDGNVKIVIFLIIAERDLNKAKRLLSEIYFMIETKEKVKTFFMNVSKDEFLKTIRG